MNSRFKAFMSMGFSTIIQMVMNILKTKVTAIVLGPVGISLLAYFNNLISTITSYTTLGLNNGIVTSISKVEDGNKDAVKKIEVTTYYITLIISIISTIIIMFYSRNISKLIFNTADNSVFIIIIAISIPFISLNRINISIINGFKSINKLAVANVISSLFILIISSALIILFKINGAVIAIPITALVSFVIYFIITLFIYKEKGIIISFSIKYFKLNEIRHLARYGVIVIVTSLITNLSMLIIRIVLVNKLGIEANGFFQAIWGISNQYLTLILSTLMIYYLPSLSSKISHIEIVKEMNDTLNMVIKIIFPVIILILLFKSIVINILYSNEFLEIVKYLPIFLIGDFIKVIAWTLSVPMYSLPKLKLQLLSEIVYDSILIISVILLTDSLGLFGIAIGYIINQILLCIIYILNFKRILKLKISKENIILIINSSIILLLLIVIDYKVNGVGRYIISILLITVWIYTNINIKEIKMFIYKLRRRSKGEK